MGFEFYPRTDLSHARLGTILPQGGGPGNSSTGTRDFYLSLFDALRDRRDVLTIDKRGTDYAAADIVAVLDALGINEVDFYGDSYGTFVSPVLAGLYPSRLRSIILDSAYPVRAPDPWFATDWAAAWSGIDLSCIRSPSCRALGGAATSRVQNIVNEVRTTPISGVAPDGNGDLQATSVDTSALINLIDAAGFGPPIYRDLDAAVRAWSDSKDALPLLRLVAE